MQTVSPSEAAALLVDKVGGIPFGVDNAELILLLVRAFHAAGRRAATIPLDLSAVRASLRCGLSLEPEAIAA